MANLFAKLFESRKNRKRKMRRGGRELSIWAFVNGEMKADKELAQHSHWSLSVVFVMFMTSALENGTANVCF